MPVSHGCNSPMAASSRAPRGKIGASVPLYPGERLARRAPFKKVTGRVALYQKVETVMGVWSLVKDA